MDSVILNVLFFIIVMIIIYFFNYYFICQEKLKTKDKKKKRIMRLTMEGTYLQSRFNLDDKLIDLKELNKGISLINAFIIAFVSTGVSLINLNIIWQLAIGFALLFALIYSLYEIYGRHLKKKWGKK
jgi:hypothetical protein